MHGQFAGSQVPNPTLSNLITYRILTGYFTLRRWLWPTQAKACPVRSPWSTVIARRLRLQYLILPILWVRKGNERWKWSWGSVKQLGMLAIHMITRSRSHSTGSIFTNPRPVPFTSELLPLSKLGSCSNPTLDRAVDVSWSKVSDNVFTPGYISNLNYPYGSN